MDDLLAGCTAFLLAHGYDAYLVGGTVRDQELGRRSQDIDLAVPASALQIARKLADHFGGAYYPLDAERETGRVVMPDHATIDVSLLRGAAIEADLAARDFTINAMARRLAQPEILLDPHHGLRDLREHRLRAVGDHIFEQDPARLLRAVRLAAELGLTIEPETCTLIQRDVALIAGLAGERARDEILRIFQRPYAAASVRLLAQLRLLAPTLPHAAADEAHLEIAERLGELNVDSTLRSAPVTAVLTEFAALLDQDLSSDLHTGRTNGAIIKLAALYDRPQAVTSDLGALRFRRDEIQYGRMLAAERGRIRELSLPVTALAAHRFFRDSGSRSGRMGLMLLALAEAPQGAGSDQRIHAVRALLAYYRDSYDRVIAPKPLVSGAELAARFGLQGRQIGDGLKAVVEAQVEGTIRTVAEAERFFGGGASD